LKGARGGGALLEVRVGKNKKKRDRNLKINSKTAEKHLNWRPEKGVESPRNISRQVKMRKRGDAQGKAGGFMPLKGGKRNGRVGEQSKKIQKKKRENGGGKKVKEGTIRIRHAN